MPSRASRSGRRGGGGEGRPGGGRILEPHSAQPFVPVGGSRRALGERGSVPSIPCPAVGGRVQSQIRAYQGESSSPSPRLATRAAPPGRDAGLEYDERRRGERGRTVSLRGR